MRIRVLDSFEEFCDMSGHVLGVLFFGNVPLTTKKQQNKVT